MNSYPFTFLSTTEARCGIQTNWKSATTSRECPVAIPPEFKGPGTGFSPEDLFNMAVTNCFIGTFKVYAENSRVTFDSVRVATKLVLDLDENRRLIMKEAYLDVVIEDASHKEKALTIAKKAAESGFILNSIKTICHFNFSAP